MLKIIIAPNEALRVKTNPVKKINPDLLRTSSEMINITKSFIDPEGVGLASTQIGRTEQFFIAKLENKEKGTKFVKIFNPEVLWYSKSKKVSLEGCLSIPNYYGEISRPSAVKVKYLNELGEEIQETLKGANAVIFQHEFDHLHGRLFIDLVMLQKSRIFKVAGKDQNGDDIFEEVSL